MTSPIGSNARSEEVVSPSAFRITTTHTDDTAARALEVSSWAFVLLWSEAEPHRVGEIAFLPTFERRLVGRGGDEVEKFACFGRHRPGEPLHGSSREGFLDGLGISRKQLLVRATLDGVEMEQVGRCATFVNGEEKTSSVLQDGDSIHVRRGAVLLCVRRRKTLSGPRALHAFGGPDAHGFVGESPAMWELRDAMAFAAADDAHVFIHGETGTGKELAAALLHNASKRAKGPWVAESAARLRGEWAGVHLFGNPADFPHPGMTASKGLVGRADGGTLFLDHITDCPRETHVRLHRLLDSGAYAPVGEFVERHAALRVVAATSRDESRLDPAFRARFSYSIRTPPLSERREDIPLLVRHILVQEGQRYPKAAGRFLRVGPAGGVEPRVHPRLIDYLVGHPLSGNVFQLEKLLLEARNASPGDEVTMPDWFE
jgi:two-component system, NtrC family, response regulator HydG